MAVWSYGYYFWQISNNHDGAIFWLRFLMAGAIFIPITYFHFTFYFLELNKTKISIYLGYILSLFFLALNFTQFFIKNLVKKLEFNFWPEPGEAFHFFLLFFAAYIIYSWYLMSNKIDESTGIKREQIKYILTATFIGFIGGSTNYFLWYNIPIPPYGNILITVYAGLIAYAILRYRLMDIKLFFGRGAVYFFSLTTAIGIAFLLMILNDFYKLLDFKTAAPLMLTAGILAFNPFFEFYEKLASRYFYYKFYNYQTVLTDLSKKLNEVIELDKLAFLITDTLINTMRLDKTGILMRDPKTGKYEIQKIFGFKEDNGISLVKDNFLTEWLTKFKKPLVCEELTFAMRDAKSDSERESVIKLGKNMNDIEASICLPLLREDKIIGIIVLGKKLSGEPYSNQDIDLLTHLTNQASIALENARLYKELNDLSKNLENKINEQVADIKELSEMKSQFLMIVDHQFRTPVSIIKGLASMLDENSVPEDKKAEFIKRLYLSSERLSVILDDIIIAQSLIGQKTNPVFLENKLEEVIGGEIKKFLPQAEAKGIKFYFKKTEAPIPFMLFDKNMITTAVSRLIDNAILYTKNGEVAVSLSIENKNNKEFAKIEVRDTGIGFLDKNMETTFKLFSRSKEAILAHPNGSGLGLFIAKKFAEAHGGEIEIKSEGKDKGTLATISLPIITEI